MTEPNHNGYTKWLCLAIGVISLLSLVGLVVIVSVEEHVEHAVIFVGLLTTLTASLVGAILTIAGLRKLGANTDKLVVQTNSRMTEMLEAAEKLAYAAGKLAGETGREQKDA